MTPLSQSRNTFALRNNYRGVSIVEMIIGLAIAAILTGLVMTGVQGIKARAAEVRCVGNLRAIGAAAHVYSAENRGDWPYFLYAMNPPQPTSAADIGGFEGVTALRQDKWNGLGKLYGEKYISDYKTFFCPADTVEKSKAPNYNWESDAGWISGSYVLRGYKQFSWKFLIADGLNPTKTANLSQRAMASCFFLRNPPHYESLAYHKLSYPVLFGDGSVSIIKYPDQILDKNNPPKVWANRDLQRSVWDYFDSSK